MGANQNEGSVVDELNNCQQEPLMNAYKKMVESLETAELDTSSSGEEEEDKEENEGEMEEEEGEGDMEDEMEETNEEEEEEEEDIDNDKGEGEEEEEEEVDSHMEESDVEQQPLDDKTLWEQMQKFGDFEEEMLEKEKEGGNEGEDEEDEDDIDMMAPLSGILLS